MEPIPEDSKVTIERVDMGTGWVCFQAGKRPPALEKLPHFLHHNFHTWLKRNPEFKVRAALPIISEGNTVAIHVWFD